VATFMVTYDLKQPTDEYADLEAAIKAVGKWWHYLQSTWIVVSSSTTSEVRDALSPHIKSGDRLLVVKLAGGWASWGLSDAATQWLRDNL
jgi:hypothetical protein